MTTWMTTNENSRKGRQIGRPKLSLPTTVEIEKLQAKTPKNLTLLKGKGNGKELGKERKLQETLPFQPQKSLLQTNRRGRNFQNENSRKKEHRKCSV